MRIAFRQLAPLLFGLAALAAAPAAAQRSHIGAHVGYDFDRDFAVAGGDDHAFDHSALSRSPLLPESVGFSLISESTAAAKNSSVLVCLVSRTQTTYGVDGQRRVDRARALRTSP